MYQRKLVGIFILFVTSAGDRCLGSSWPFDGYEPDGYTDYTDYTDTRPRPSGSCDTENQNALAEIKSEIQNLQQLVVGLRQKLDPDFKVEPSEQSYDRWTRTATGCSCYFNKGSKVCACCYSGGCQCSESNLHQCVECNHGENCGRAQPYDRWTTTPTGCSCYFNKSSTECACCEPGGCQCSESNLHQCVECNHGENCGRAESKCPSGFEYVKQASSCYKVVYEALDWTSANQRCHELDPKAHLVAITTSEENTGLTAYLQKALAKSQHSRIYRPWGADGTKFWTSGQRLNETSCTDEFVWKLSNNTQLPLSFTFWNRDEPNCWRNELESCLEMRKDAGFKWNDVPCDIVLYPLCEYDPL